MGVSFGRYQLLRKIGRGGMAEVFLAQLGQENVTKLLAIKRLLPAYSSDQRLVLRLAAEARLTVWLTHPNIVQIFDFGKIDDSYFIAMEYVDGCDLRSLIQPSGKAAPIQLPLEVALDLGYRITDALRYAHACTDATGKPLGIIHRDVSPHNVLISRDGHPKLADFGVARAVSSIHFTQPGAVLGKYSYMAPEQARGKDYDARVDIYAAGATLYQMLTGSKPFPKRAAATAVKNTLPRPPSSLRPSIPKELDALVLGAMAPNPDARFKSAAQLADALLEQLRIMGGPPKPHQMSQLVKEVLEQRQRNRAERNEAVQTPATLGDFGAKADDEGSLIVKEITKVKQHVLSSDPTQPGRPSETETLQSLPETKEVVIVPLGLQPADPTHPGSPPVTDPRSLPETKEVEIVPLALQPADLAGEPDEARATEEVTVSDVRPSALAVTVSDTARSTLEVTAPDTIPVTAPPRRLLQGRRPWIVGLAVLGALVIFSLGLLVGRATAPRVPEPVTRPRAEVGPRAVTQPMQRRSERTRVKLAQSDTKREPQPSRGRKSARSPRPLDKGAALLRDRNPQAAEALRREILAAAQKAYLEDNHRQAIVFARQVLLFIPNDTNAWQIIGGSSCHLRLEAEARQAIDRVSPRGRRLIRTICSRKGIPIPD
jgi:serine/threonine-protein kinase